jgi:Protein of unknown function (DUF1559)
MSKLRQIALALDRYAKEHGALPPVYTTDANGKPLHSWRTLILPYLDEKQLYESIDLSKPWDDPVNAKALSTHLSIFQCPSAPSEDNRTTFLAVVTPNSCLRPNESRKIAEITDGVEETVAVVEFDKEHAVPWMSPMDADESLILRMLGPKSKTPHPGGFNAAFVSGDIKSISTETSADDLRAMISIAGNDKVDASKAK